MSTRKQILAGFLEEVWSQGDVGAVERYLAAQYTIKHDPGDPWHGQTLTISQFKARLVQSRAPFPVQHFTVVEMIEEDDVVAAAWTWRGAHTGEIAGFPPTGREITMSGITLYYFQGDEICGHFQIADRLGVMVQLQANKR